MPFVVSGPLVLVLCHTRYSADLILQVSCLISSSQHMPYAPGIPNYLQFLHILLLMYFVPSAYNVFLPLFLALHFFPVPSLLWLDLHVCPVKELTHIVFSVYFWFLPPDPGPLVDTMFLTWSSGPMEENKRASAGLQQGSDQHPVQWACLVDATKISSPFKNGPSGAPHLCSCSDVQLLSVSFQ